MKVECYKYWKKELYLFFKFYICGDILVYNTLYFSHRLCIAVKNVVLHLGIITIT
jgi:hypothetical protein